MASKLDLVRNRLSGATLVGFEPSTTAPVKRGEAKLGGKIAASQPVAAKAVSAKLGVGKKH